MNIKLVSFSGTGNTDFLSKKISKSLQLIKDFEVINLRVDDQIDNFEIEEGDLFGLGYPVFDYKPPRIIMEFLNNIRFSIKPIPVFIFSTYTTNPRDCNSHVIDLLKKKNYYVISQNKFKAPGASIFLYSNPKLLKSKTVFDKNIETEIMNFSQSIENSLSNFYTKPYIVPYNFDPLNKLHQSISNKLFGYLFYKNLKIDNKCNNCSLCIKNCPDNNLYIKDGKVTISSKNSCSKCLRCIKNCNKSAINFTSTKRRGHYTDQIIENAYLQMSP